MRHELLEEMKSTCVRALPQKAYGLIGGRRPDRPETLYPCRTNLRHDPEWRPIFEAHGDFYRALDRGFVIDPREYREILRAMKENDCEPIGVFHSHRCRAAEPSRLDRDLHYFGPSLVCFIVSVASPDDPEVRAYRIDDGETEEIPIDALA